MKKANKHKKRLKAKTISEIYPDGSDLRVSNYIKTINKKHVVLILKEDYKRL